MSSVSCVCISPLPCPEDLHREFPLSHTMQEQVAAFRMMAANILSKEDPRLAIILGPCSIHECDQAMEYASKIKALQARVQKSFFLIMRVFFEKPRTRLGWKGLIYDPYLDGSNDLSEGLKRSRKLLTDLVNLGVPTATEFLEPLIAPYLSSLVTWGLIGARTSASQPHRQLASGLPFPIGFKNGVYGELEPAIDGVASAKSPHTHFSINHAGRLSAVQTTGNPLAHLVLRGSTLRPNCDPQSVQNALLSLREHRLEERVIIDCAHGNSGKDLERQRKAFENCMEQVENGCEAIRGVMLESNLASGKQPLGDEPDSLIHGVSITDPCLGWEDTERLILLFNRIFHA